MKKLTKNDYAKLYVCTNFATIYAYMLGLDTKTRFMITSVEMIIADALVDLGTPRYSYDHVKELTLEDYAKLYECAGFARYYIAGNSIDELMDVVDYVDDLLTDILKGFGYFELDYTDQQKLAYEDKECDK